MPGIVDVTANIIRGMGLEVNPVSTAPHFVGIAAKLPNDTQAFFIWSEMDDGDYHFRIARFWQSESPFSMGSYTDLPLALNNLMALINL